jgi:hypothetical protein
MAAEIPLMHKKTHFGVEIEDAPKDSNIANLLSVSDMNEYGEFREITNAAMLRSENSERLV